MHVQNTVFSVCPRRLSANSMYKAKLHEQIDALYSNILHLIGAQTSLRELGYLH